MRKEYAGEGEFEFPGRDIGFRGAVMDITYRLSVRQRAKEVIGLSSRHTVFATWVGAISHEEMT
jgi:hypothetical protein